MRSKLWVWHVNYLINRIFRYFGMQNFAIPYHGIGKIQLNTDIPPSSTYYIHVYMYMYEVLLITYMYMYEVLLITYTCTCMKYY